MRKLLAVSGMVIATASSMAGAVEIGSVKIVPNIEAGWQKGKISYDVSGSTSNGIAYIYNYTSDAKTEFNIGQISLEAQYKNYLLGVRYTHDRFKGTGNYYYSDNTGYTTNGTNSYSKTLERYFAYAGYQFNLNNIEIKPYVSFGYFNSNDDKGDFTGLGLTGKLNLPYGFGVFLGGEYDKTFNGKSKWNNVVDKDIKDMWEISTGISKKIPFGEFYVKTYYREHKLNTTNSGDLGGGVTYNDTTNNYKFKATGLMIGLNF